MSQQTPEIKPGPGKRFSLISVLRLLIAVVVVATLIYVIGSSAQQLSQSEFSFATVSYQWWILAIAVYMTTMLLSCSFWHRVLLALGQKPAFSRSVLAYVVSQLGKYVPGKAMVVVMRTDIIRGEKVETGPAAASVFVETLTWIFIGSAISTLLFAFLFREQQLLGATAIGLTLAAGILTWPPVFKKLASTLSAVLKRGTGSNSAEKRFAGLNLSTMAYGWIVMTIGWSLNGLSLWFVLKGLPGSGVEFSDFPLTLMCVALATVAGFVSLLPGGLGVRELVIIPLLGARFGPVTALVAAVAIRMVWLAAEIISSAIIYGVFGSKR